MYNCNVQTIPQDRMRYATIGDWFMEGGCLQVKVSSMGNGDYEFLVGMHELIEKQICRKLGFEIQRHADDPSMVRAVLRLDRGQ